MQAPKEPLKDYKSYCENICAKLKLLPTPLEIMSEIAILDSRSEEDPISRDLLDRLIIFSSNVIQHGLPDLISNITPMNIFKRMIPWFRLDGEQLVIQNIPPWISRIDAFNLTMMYLIVDDAINNNNFTHSKEIHNAFYFGSIQKKINTIKNRDENFDELVQESLGYNTRNISCID